MQLVIFANPGQSINMQVITESENNIEVLENITSWEHNFKTNLDDILDTYDISDIIIQGNPAFTEHFVQIINANYPDIDINSDKIIHSKN